MNPAVQSAFESMVAHHLSHYPGLRIHDLYKLVFQAAMGSEHAVVDAVEAERRLRAEAESVTTAPGNTPMIDPVSPDGRLARVNLHPFKTHGGDLGNLASAFIATSCCFKPSRSALATYWGWLKKLAEADGFPFTEGELESFGNEQKEQQYPAVHHSSIYRQLYHPAYRVVLIDRIELPV